MKLPRIHIGRPQQLASLLLFLFLVQGLYLIGHTPLSESDYRYARCGREMWERPSPILGYFTSCGNMQGDGTFAYRAAGFPLTVQRWVLLAADHFRSPENRLYPGGTLNGSTWEMRHQLSYVAYLLRVPFLFFAVWLGGALWWVARRLFGNEGGFFTLALYCFSSTVLEYATMPNNEILAAWGLFGLIYTAIGVTHAMQGPRRKWRPRIVLLMLALGFTAAAHVLAAIFGFVASAILMVYLGERRRGAVMQVLTFSAMGALLLVFAFFAFRPAPFSYLFTAGSGRFWFSLAGTRNFFLDVNRNAAFEAALAVALLLWLGIRRSRYFGNTVPLLISLGLLPLLPTGVHAAPWFWAIPFLMVFTGGVFADILETRHRKLFLSLAGAILVTQAALCVVGIYRQVH